MKYTVTSKWEKRVFDSWHKHGYSKVIEKIGEKLLDIAWPEYIDNTYGWNGREKEDIDYITTELSIQWGSSREIKEEAQVQWGEDGHIGVLLSGDIERADKAEAYDRLKETILSGDLLVEAFQNIDRGLADKLSEGLKTLRDKYNKDIDHEHWKKL